MTKTRLLIASLLISISLVAQEANPEKEKTVEFSGLIRYDAYFDTYQSSTLRDGDVYLYPLKQKLNADNKDINAYNQLNMFAYETRLRAKVNGPEALGAKLSGLIEIDFEGRANGHENAPRARHLFMNLDWGKTKLLFGQYWHPLFVTECFPEVLVAGGGAPFNPFNRSTQVLLKHKLSTNLEIGGAAVSHFDMSSIAGVPAQNNAAIPDFHGHLKYISSNISTGLVGGYRILKPRTMLADSTLTTQKLGSFDVAAFLKIKHNNHTLKFYGVYGQEMTPFIMIGGAAPAQDPLTVADYSYGNINTFAVWSEYIYKWNAFDFGLFVAYTANTGSDTENLYVAQGFTRNADIDNIFRLSPRAIYTSGKLSFTLEYMLTGATYTDIQNNSYKALKTYDAVYNHRMAFAAAYTF
jgi:hypothetical protein